MRHLSNIYDHRKPDARNTTPEEAWRQHLEWINRNVIGRPQATETYTVEQLEAMGMIGIYAPEAAAADDPDHLRPDKGGNRAGDDYW